MYTATIPGLAGKTMLTDLERRRTAYGLNARELMSSPRLKAGDSLGVLVTWGRTACTASTAASCRAACRAAARL